jgi:hypothetical protein
MKKIHIFFGILSLAFISCKKDYTCVCSSNFLGSAITVTTQANSSKSSADEWCKSIQSVSETKDGNPSASQLTYVCEIK